MSTIDCSQRASWYAFPEICKSIDTFYVYATKYIMGSFGATRKSQCAIRLGPEGGDATSG